MFENIEVNSLRWMDNKLLKNEEFREISNYNSYLVSNYGRVKNKRTKKILKQDKNKDGYYRIDLYCNKIKKHKKVHKLVAEAFLNNPMNLKCVNHKDENKLNNNINNLEFCDYSYNINYGSRNKEVSKKLSKQILQIDKDNNIVKTWNSMIEIEKKLNINRGRICLCCQNKIEYIQGYKFKYLN